MNTTAVEYLEAGVEALRHATHDHEITMMAPASEEAGAIVSRKGRAVQ